jgi:hypothetical protein
MLGETLEGTLIGDCFDMRAAFDQHVAAPRGRRW